MSLRSIVIILLVPLASLSLRAQDDIPIVNQPRKLVDRVNFFHAKGSLVKVSWNVNPRTVPEDGELTATLTISHAANPRQIIRPDLRKLREFQTRFVIEDNAAPPPMEHAEEVSFSYRLRPRSRTVKIVPALEFYYYNPSAPSDNQFKLTMARAVEITVTQAPRHEPPAVAMSEPDNLFAITTGPRVLGSAAFLPGAWVWVGLGVLGPSLALMWFVAWRRVFPDELRAAKQRRSRAARRALDAVRKAGRSVDPPAAIAAAVRSYLRARHPLPETATTPGEIEAGLASLGLHVTECDAAGEFFRACDAARFSPTGDIWPSLAAMAAMAISRLESSPEPQARGMA